MQVLSIGSSDVGKKRAHNEDYLLLAPELGLFIVCDGMGGHAAGEVASELAACTVRRCIEQNKAVLDAYDDSAPARDQLLRMVEDAIKTASRAVFALARSEKSRAGMGTTLTMMLCVRQTGVMGHVGDSRLYMRRQGRLHQLSEDHTYINEMIRRGMGTAEGLKHGAYANVITRAVGIQANVNVDTLSFDLLEGDSFLLCSDGLQKHLEDPEEIGQVLDNDHLNSIPQQLIEIANARGGTDNISAVVLRINSGAGEAEQQRERTTEVNLRIDTLHEVELFQQLDMGELCKILHIVRVQKCEQGDVIMREGEAGNSLFAILHGKFVVTRAGRPITWLQRGSHFGEMALFNNRPRSATIEAIERSRLLVIERDRFNDLVRKEPLLGVKLLWAFAQVLSLRLDETSIALYGSGSARDTDVSQPFPKDR